MKKPGFWGDCVAMDGLYAPASLVMNERGRAGKLTTVCSKSLVESVVNLNLQATVGYRQKEHQAHGLAS